MRSRADPENFRTLEGGRREIMRLVEENKEIMRRYQPLLKVAIEENNPIDAMTVIELYRTATVFAYGGPYITMNPNIAIEPFDNGLEPIELACLCSDNIMIGLLVQYGAEWP